MAIGSLSRARRGAFLEHLAEPLVVPSESKLTTKQVNKEPLGAGGGGRGAFSAPTGDSALTLYLLQHPVPLLSFPTGLHLG